MGRRWGQHFLFQPRWLKRIAEAALPDHEPLTIEIGAGTGNLTAYLLERTDHLVAIEIDPKLVELLHRRFPAHPRLEIVQADVLTLDLAQWGPAVITGNLPYYISSPIIEKILSLGSYLRRAVLMLQKEVAARLVASPGTRAFGSLTVATQLRAKARWLFSVPPSAFHPRPKVVSAVVELSPQSPPRDLDVPQFLEFVRTCFRHKRKILKHNLAALLPPHRLANFPEMQLRAEQLSLEQLIALYRKLSASQTLKPPLGESIS